MLAAFSAAYLLRKDKLIRPVAFLLSFSDVLCFAAFLAKVVDDLISYDTSVSGTHRKSETYDSSTATWVCSTIKYTWSNQVKTLWKSCESHVEIRCRLSLFGWEGCSNYRAKCCSVQFLNSLSRYFTPISLGFTAAGINHQNCKTLCHDGR